MSKLEEDERFQVQQRTSIFRNSIGCIEKNLLNSLGFFKVNCTLGPIQFDSSAQYEQGSVLHRQLNEESKQWKLSESTSPKKLKVQKTFLGYGGYSSFVSEGNNNQAVLHRNFGATAQRIHISKRIHRKTMKYYSSS